MGLLDTRPKRNTWCAISFALGLGAMMLYLYIAAPNFSGLGQPDDPQQPILVTGVVIFFVVAIIFYVLIAIIDRKK